MADSKYTEAFTLPEGRVINESLFVKDAFNDKSTPAYKVEMAFDADSEEFADFQEMLYEAAESHFGREYEDGDLKLPILDGNKLAQKREKKEKDGSAYKGTLVVRASTIYNKNGENDSGGIQVLDADAEDLEPARKSEVYNGCYGVMAATVGFYETDDGDDAIKLYLVAFQKTRDGDPLRSSSDRSGLFKPVNREAGEGKRQRRSRG